MPRKRVDLAQVDVALTTDDDLPGRVDEALERLAAEAPDVAWSSHGRWLATGSMDGTARLWAADTGRGDHDLASPENVVLVGEV